MLISPNVNNQWVPSSVILRIYLEETSTILHTKPTTFFLLLLHPIFAKSKVVGSFKWFFYKKFSCLLLYGELKSKKVLDLHMDGCSDVIQSICLKQICLISCKLQVNPMIHHQSQQAPKGISYLVASWCSTILIHVFVGLLAYQRQGYCVYIHYRE
jgi:hypothetical protein